MLKLSGGLKVAIYFSLGAAIIYFGLKAFKINKSNEFDAATGELLVNANSENTDGLAADLNPNDRPQTFDKDMESENNETSAEGHKSFNQETAGQGETQTQSSWNMIPPPASIDDPRVAEFLVKTRIPNLGVIIDQSYGLDLKVKSSPRGLYKGDIVFANDVKWSMELGRGGSALSDGTSVTDEMIVIRDQSDAIIYESDGPGYDQFRDLPTSTGFLIKIRDKFAVQLYKINGDKQIIGNFYGVEKGVYTHSGYVFLIRVD